MHKQRTEKLLALLSETESQGVLIQKPSNMRWLSGYTGEGALLITDNLWAVVTDFRYTEQAEMQAPDYKVFITTPEDKEPKVVAGLLAEMGIKTLCFEDDYLTVKGMKLQQEAAPDVSFVPVDRKPEKLREIKDESEIALIEKACGVTCQAYDYIVGYIKGKIAKSHRVRLTEIQVRNELESALIRFGADRPAFDSIVATGANGSLPHAIPGDRVIRRGHMLTMDFGAKIGGYCADMTRTVAIGEIDAESRKIYDTVLRAQLMALDLIRPGADCREVDRLARTFIGEAGYEGRFGHGLGHSLGLDIHEPPRLSTISEDTLAAGMVVTDEPGIYIPGQCGCRIEDTVLVTEDGCRRLTTADKELMIL